MVLLKSRKSVHKMFHFRTEIVLERDQHEHENSCQCDFLDTQVLEAHHAIQWERDHRHEVPGEICQDTDGPDVKDQLNRYSQSRFPPMGFLIERAEDSVVRHGTCEPQEEVYASDEPDIDELERAHRQIMLKRLCRHPFVTL
jgi:hypothetical protein